MSSSLVLGIDPSKQFFTATLLKADGDSVWKARDYPMNRSGFQGMTCAIPAGDLTIAVEASGRIDQNLMTWLTQWKAGCRDRQVILLRINPGQSARFGGPKPRRTATDGTDSAHIAEFARVYRRQLDAFEADLEVQAMGRLVSERNRLVQGLAAIKCQLQDQLLVCFPEFTAVFKDPCCRLARAVLQVAPTAAKAKGKKPLSLARVKAGRKERSLGITRATQLIELARNSIASATAGYDADAMVFLVRQLEFLEQRVRTIERVLESYVEESRKEQDTARRDKGVCVGVGRQIELADSVPGIGIVGAATIVLKTRGIARFHSGKALSAQLASCPERTQTGTSLNKTRLTSRGDHKTRAMLYMLAQTASQFDPAFAFYKWRLIRGGLCPQQAVCAVMNKMCRVIWALVNNDRPYDVNRMIEQIRIHHAVLWVEFCRERQRDRRLWKKMEPEQPKTA